ncbi:uncharacterized protein LOC112082266 isoform X2 [Eutrema salsugineum]|uniref:uncharacterized protein LOC112082266 isoform X2 n=1 Tax=Eutrema salsugineum TaxID=72664 RepID=UPI000CECE8C1|nr:uncharacterized protein LOC112082266 isoform X2 [Eutrema salsugineum]
MQSSNTFSNIMNPQSMPSPSSQGRWPSTYMTEQPAGTKNRYYVCTTLEPTSHEPPLLTCFHGRTTAPTCHHHHDFSNVVVITTTLTTISLWLQCFVLSIETFICLNHLPLLLLMAQSL